METSPFLKLISLTLLLAWFSLAMAVPVLPSLEEQAGALLAWKATLESQPDQLQTWRNTTWPCSWHGISCRKHQASHQEVIAKISLWRLGLRGKLDTLNFTALATLTSIQLAHNQIRGSFPSALASSLPSLQHLMLGANELSGQIPSQIKHLKSLVELDLSANHLSGPIPTELGYLYKLLTLDLTSNNLTGSIPKKIGNLTELTILYLSDNQLSGCLPREIGNLVNLEDLALSNNTFTGSIPKVFGNLTKITTLYLDSNQFTGYLPHELGYMLDLEKLDLSDNTFMGSIPGIFQNFTKLTALYLVDNQFSGHIPRQIGILMNLKYLQLDGNNLSGPLPPELCAGGQLKKLTASNNNLNGFLPSRLINCRSIVRVSLERNQIEGDISELGVHPNLMYMDMSSNKLFGQLSYRWRECRNLTMLRLSKNNLAGKIPASIGELSQLVVLDLSSNNLVGELPSAMGNLKKLYVLNIAGNLLHGSIPQEIRALSSLQLVDLSSNNLSGSIKGSIEHCLMLCSLNLSHNSFNGSIPVKLGMLFNLHELLDLSDNSFVGAIPSQLSGLSMLAILNLSHNKLNGLIPSSFKIMSSLTSIDVSCNELEGPVPESRLFQEAPIQWFMHNKMLCGVVKGLPPCSGATQGRGKSKGYKKLLLCMVLALISLVPVALTWIFRHEREKFRSNNTDRAPQADVFCIWSFDGADVFKQIIEATNNFSEVHCIGTGGYGSVYKAALARSKIFAVKKIHLIEDDFCLNKSVFTREIEALVQIRHRNIVKLFGYCSSSQGRFLIYEYMERGNLAETLNASERAIELDWKRRIQLALDVVHALAYMHHDCPSPIVHRDITSNNILLDVDFRACISDFGAAKILNINGLNLTSLAGTKGYLAPELAYTENVTEKCDIYSFGVLVLELFLGSHPGDLLSSIYLKTRKNDVCMNDLLDSRLELPEAEIAKKIYGVLNVAVQCLEPNPSGRPTARCASEELSAGIKTCAEEHVDYLHAVLTIHAQ